MISPSEKLLRIREVSEWLGVSKTTVYKWVKEGRFPEPVILADHASRWVEAEVVAWLASRPRGVKDD